MGRSAVVGGLWELVVMPHPPVELDNSVVLRELCDDRLNVLMKGSR